MTLSLSLLMPIYYLAAQKPVPPHRATVTCGWWRACKLSRVLCWRVIWAPCLAGILAQQLFVLTQYGAVTCRLMGKNKVERCRELSDIVRRTHSLERLPWIYASSCQLWDMQQGASWNFFFLLLRARFIYLAAEWVLLGDVAGLLLSLVMQWARCGKDTHILSLNLSLMALVRWCIPGIPAPG